jgi:hypothetical protein
MQPLSVWPYFQDLKEPRVERTRRHKRMDIVDISVMAGIAYGDDGDEVLERLPAVLQAIRSACRRLLRAHVCASGPILAFPRSGGRSKDPRCKRVPIRPVTKAFRHIEPRAFGLGSCQRAARPGTFPRCGGRPGWGLEPGSCSATRAEQTQRLSSLVPRTKRRLPWAREVAQGPCGVISSY